VVERTFSWIEKNRRMSLGTTKGYVRAAKRVGICCHESPHGEAVDPPVRPFHTVSPGTSVNKPPIDAPEPSQWHHGCCRLVGENARWQEEKLVCPHRRT
jgi:hypothetical protein